MSIEFSFEELPGFDDFRGRLVVKASGAADVLEAVKFFKLHHVGDEVDNAMKLVELVQAGEVVNVVENKKRPYYEINGTVANDFVQPYMRRLEELTGYNRGVLPDLDFTKHFDKLGNCQFIEKVWSEFGSLYFKIYDQAEDWNGKPAAQLAESYAVQSMAKELSHEPFEKEFVENRNGTYSRNPHYATGRKLPLVPCCAAAWLCNDLWAWWVANESNEAQRSILKLSDDLGSQSGAARHSGYGTSSQWGDYAGVYYKAESGSEWDGNGTKFRVMKWEDFRVLK